MLSPVTTQYMYVSCEFLREFFFLIPRINGLIFQSFLRFYSIDFKSPVHDTRLIEGCTLLEDE